MKSFNDALRYSATLPRLHFHVFEVQKPKVLLLLSTLRRDIEMKIPQGEKFTVGKKLSQSVSFLLRRQKRFIYSNLESVSSSCEVVSIFNSFSLTLTKIFFSRVLKKVLLLESECYLTVLRLTKRTSLLWPRLFWKPKGLQRSNKFGLT